MLKWQNLACRRLSQARYYFVSLRARSQEIRDFKIPWRDATKTSFKREFAFFQSLSWIHVFLPTYSVKHEANPPEGSLPADVLWGSFVTLSFLPHLRGGEMNTSRMNPNGRLRGGYPEGRPEGKFQGTKSKFRKRNKISSLLVYDLHKTIFTS